MYARRAVHYQMGPPQANHGSPARMQSMLDSFSSFLFAEAEGGQNTFGNQLLFMLPAIALIVYFVVLRPNKNERRHRQNMLDALKRDDHVVTIGGIKGIVANVNTEDDEVVLKVDETTGTKLKVLRSSIARVITAEDEAAKKDAAKKDS